MYPNLELKRDATGRLLSADEVLKLQTLRQQCPELQAQMGPGLVPVPPATSISALMTKQSEAISHLHEHISQLGGALLPVLKSPSPEADGKGRLNPVAHSEMAQQIANDTLAIEGAIALLVEIRNRLDL